MNLIDVSGNRSVFLLKGEVNVLFDTGMSYSAADTIARIRKEIGDGVVDAVMLSHSHYDHVAGLPSFRKAWPGLKSIGSKRCDEVLHRPGALKTMRELSETVAASVGKTIDKDYSEDGLYVDIIVADGEMVQIGEHRITAMEAIGHTQCSMNYFVDDEILFCCETVGVITHKGAYNPSYLISYDKALETLHKTAGLVSAKGIEKILLSHYGLTNQGPATEVFRRGIWTVLDEMMQDSKERMIKIIADSSDENEALERVTEAFHTGIIPEREQPRVAFQLNAAAMIKTLMREYGVICKNIF